MGQRPAKPLSVAFIASYVPRRCGIATFTHDLAKALAALMGGTLGERELVQIVALNNLPESPPFGPEVCFEIRDHLKTDYRKAADFLNVSLAEVVNLQHEFGILGGADGSHVLTLLSSLKKPVVTTLHTVLHEPTKGQLETLQEICRLSSLVVVMADRARNMLRDIYGVPEEKILLIHHGVPDVPFMDPSYYKDRFHVEGRRVILTFGLLNPNKGIEVGLDALHEVVKTHPDVAYIVLGATHPEVKRRHGEEYRLSLQQRAAKLGLSHNVLFHDWYVTLEELCEFLLACDIYVTPYRTREQIVSGTLAYALGCGKAIISTPYWYAEEMLAEDRGRLVPFDEPAALAERIRDLLDNEVERTHLRKNAYQLGREMIWRQVGWRYREAFERAIAEYGRLRRALAPRPVSQPAIPELSLRHLHVLSDGTGVLQHAMFATPDRAQGYSTDDNARALLVTSLYWDTLRDESLIPRIHTYLAFLTHAFNQENGRFRNFMTYDRRWADEIGSEDCQGKALWALGYCVALAPNESILGLATRLVVHALRACSSLQSPRAWAYVLLGCYAYLRRFDGASEVRRLGMDLAQRLMERFEANASDDWPWCEDVLSYANARLPQALLVAGRWTGDDRMHSQGLRSLAWLLDVQTGAPDGHLSIIGNKGWLRRGGTKADFDQQPVEAACLTDACHEAYLATHEERWFAHMRVCFHWFLGENDVRVPIYDFTTQGCRDGLHEAGASENEGAESTLAWLHSLYLMHEVTADRGSVCQHESGLERVAAF